jgi:hypothetical protein
MLAVENTENQFILAARSRGSEQQNISSVADQVMESFKIKF